MYGRAEPLHDADCHCWQVATGSIWHFKGSESFARPEALPEVTTEMWTGFRSPYGE